MQESLAFTHERQETFELLRKERSKLRGENAQLRAEVHALSAKIVELQAGPQGESSYLVEFKRMANALESLSKSVTVNK